MLASRLESHEPAVAVTVPDSPGDRSRGLRPMRNLRNFSTQPIPGLGLENVSLEFPFICHPPLAYTLIVYYRRTDFTNREAVLAETEDSQWRRKQYASRALSHNDFCLLESCFRLRAGTNRR